MAHFAKLNTSNVVLAVVVVDNSDLIDELGEENELTGIAFLKNLLGYSKWKQTSYNGAFRKNFAGPGYKYDKTRDAFIPPKPYPSWLLNEDTCRWEAPIERPSTPATWNEETQSWDPINP